MYLVHPKEGKYKSQNPSQRKKERGRKHLQAMRLRMAVRGHWPLSGPLLSLFSAYLADKFLCRTFGRWPSALSMFPSFVVEFGSFVVGVLLVFLSLLSFALFLRRQLSIPRDPSRLPSFSILCLSLRQARPRPSFAVLVRVPADLLFTFFFSTASSPHFHSFFNVLCPELTVCSVPLFPSPFS